MKPCPCDRLGPTEVGSCKICWLWYHDTAFRVQFGGPEAQPPLPTRKYRKMNGSRRPECPYLGAIVSFCTSCRNPDVQAFRNVHRCEHPEHAEEMGNEGLVTRGQHCETCSYFPNASDPV